MVPQINLTESNSQKVEELSRQTGKSPEQLVNEAINRFATEAVGDEREKFLAWCEALLRIEGMW